MNINITEQLPNGVIIQAESACGRYKWFCGQEGYIHDAHEGRSIYQMAYLKRAGEGFGSDPLPKQVATEVRSFLKALQPLVNARKEAADDARIQREADAIAEREAILRRMDSHMHPDDR